MHTDVITLNDEIHAMVLDRMQAHFNHVVKTCGYAACLQAIKAAAVDTGFIKYDLKTAVRYAIATDTPGLTYRFQYNPARALRYAGAGRKEAPPGRALDYDGCPLTPNNMKVLQCGTEIPYACELAGTPYNIVPQPYPFGDTHFVAAVQTFRPQDVPAPDVKQILREMCALAAWSTDYVVMLNGSDGAGATIDWFHTQAITRPGGELFPVEALAARQIRDGELQMIDGYPVPVVVTRGPTDDAIQSMADLIVAWMESYGSCATMNLIATSESCAKDETVIYFCPRDRRNARVPGFSGAVGCLEILGELLGCSEEDLRRIDRRQIDAQYIEYILATVGAEDFANFMARYQPRH